MLEIPTGPITVTVTKRFDKENPAHNLYVCKTDGGKTVNAYKPDEGDDSHMPFVQVEDRIKVAHLVAANRQGEFKGKLLPRNEQPNAAQTKWKRREQGEHRPMKSVKPFLSEELHDVLDWMVSLEGGTKEQTVSNLLEAALHPYRVQYLAAKERGES